MHRLRLTLTLFPALLMALAVACGGDDDPGSTGDGGSGDGLDIPALCQSIPIADIEAILGIGVSKVEVADQPDGVLCTWSIEIGGAVIVRFYTSGADGVFSAAQQAFNGEDVSGLGDAAYFAEDTQALYVKTGNIVFFSQDVSMNPAFEPPEGWHEQMATRILAALP